MAKSTVYVNKHRDILLYKQLQLLQDFDLHTMFVLTVIMIISLSSENYFNNNIYSNKYIIKYTAGFVQNWYWFYRLFEIQLSEIDIIDM